MIITKTPQEIAIMKKAGHMLATALQETCQAVKPGISEIELDKLAEKSIRAQGGEPGFKKVEGYHNTLCIETNDVVVHGIPRKYVLKEGDIVGLDCGVFLQGFHTDMAETVRVLKAPSKASEWLSSMGSDYKTHSYDSTEEDEVDRFLRIGKEAMWDGINQVKAGNRVGHISAAMQEKAEKIGGYSVVRSLVGHGVGRELHEDPEIPGYATRPIEKTPLLKPGMTIAIEIIYIMGGKEVAYRGDDDWTIVSEDGSLSAMFERSVVVTEAGFELITV